MATILGANTLSSAYDVANGVRFEDGDNAKMSRSISGSPTDPEKYTFSCWIKRGNLTEGVILGNYANANFRASLWLARYLHWGFLPKPPTFFL